MTDTPVLIFGKNGQLESALVSAVADTPNVFAYDIPEIDILDYELLANVISSGYPDLSQRK